MNERNISGPGVAKMIAQEIKNDVDRFAVEKYDGGFRTHLGCSLIGHDCKRYLWYSFRWAHREQFDGRMQRLFNRGHREEDRFVEYLRGIGAQVWTHDDAQPPKANGELPQYRVTWCGGHAGGSLDGVVVLPEKYGIPYPLLAEFKTKGDGRKWQKLVEDGMPYAEPKHWAQTCSYATEYDLNGILYMSVNKNTEDLFVQILKTDRAHGAHMKAKAGMIVDSRKAPPRISDNPTFSACVYCPMKKICHEGAPLEKNCRSCKNAVPIANAKWLCELYGQAIPDDVIATGCPQWSDIRNA
jgi:hypothetical protein